MLSPALPLGSASQGPIAGRGGWQAGAGPRTPAVFRVTRHQNCCPTPKVACGKRREDPTFSLVSQVPATLSLPPKVMSQPLASSPSLGAHRSALSLMPCREGPSRKACGCPQSPGVRDPLIGRPRPQLPQALRSSFAWPWSCPHGNKRSGSAEGSRRRKTYSGSCGSRSQNTEHQALKHPGWAVRAMPPSAFVTYLFINCLLLSSRPGALGVGLH